MTESRPDSPEQMIRYLLAKLSDREADEIEERYFQDEEYFARLELAAEDLAALYVEGRLSRDDRVRFERHCLGSRDDRLRVRLAEAVRTYQARPQAGDSFFRTLTSCFTQALSVRFAAAAAGAVLVVGSSVLAVRTVHVQGELARLRGEMSTELASQREAAAAAVHQERAQRDALARRLADLTTTNFVLMPGLERGSSVDLIVSANASLVRFELAHERPAASGRYRATLRTVDRAIVWSESIGATSGAPGASFVFVVPASAIDSGEYEIVLQSVDPSGAATDVANYPFRIRRNR